MIAVILKRRMNATTLLIISSCIVASGTFTTFPEILLGTLNVNMSYKVSNHVTHHIWASRDTNDGTTSNETRMSTIFWLISVIINSSINSTGGTSVNMYNVLHISYLQLHHLHYKQQESSRTG